MIWNRRIGRAEPKQPGAADALLVQDRKAHCLGMLIAAIIGVWGAATYAAAPQVDGVGPTRLLNLPSPISVPRDAPPGTLLTDWIKSPEDGETYSWTTKNSIFGDGVGMDLHYIGGNASVNDLDDVVEPPESGGRVQVRKTNVPGIGLALSTRVHNTACGSEWTPFSAASDNGGILLYQEFCKHQTNGNFKSGSQLAVALVKLADQVSPGTVSATSVVQGTPWNNDRKMSGSPTPTTYKITAVQITQSTCQTPNVPVDMGTVSAGDFEGVDTKTTPKDFKIMLKNCPGGMNSIKYQLDPTTPIKDKSNSVITLQAGGATGVGLQLMDNSGSAVPLQEAIPVSDYHGSGGNFTIPLKAAYYQTDSKITGGAANAAVDFTMTYE